MASTRIINYVLYKRFVAISNLKNVCILSTFNINSNFRQNAYYCTKKSIVKTDPVERENKIQVGFADVGKFRRYICENIHNVKIDATLIIIFYFSQRKYKIYWIFRRDNWWYRNYSFHVLYYF
uniref:Uncharacterized protein n=1 Tax=Apis cerana TaxID=7461 RepID=V9IDV3_APICE